MKAARAILGCCGILVTTAPATAISSVELRELLVASMAAPRQEQHVSFGPLLDGRVVKIDIAFDASYSTTGISALGNDRYLVKVDREQVAKAFVVMDAMLVCARFPEQTCHLVADVVRDVNGLSSIGDARFLDEIHPQSASLVRSTREETALHLASLTAGVENLMLVLDLHEIGHAVLGHLAGPATRENSAFREAEADGFAVAVLALTEQPAVGAIAPLMDVMFAEEVLGEATLSHPPAICRVAAFAEATISWVHDNAATISASGNDEQLDSLASDMMERIDTFEDPLLGPLELDADCSSYAAGFAAGSAAAARLVEQDTILDVSGPTP